VNMLATIVPKSDQLNADDLIGRDLTMRITDVKIRAGQEQPVSISFEGDNGKPYKPCKSMCRVMVAAWGPDAAKYKGRYMTLRRDPTVTWAGLEVGGIRISHMSDIDSAMTMALTMTKAKKKPFTVKPLATPTAPAQDKRDGVSPVAATPDAGATTTAAATQVKGDIAPGVALQPGQLASAAATTTDAPQGSIAESATAPSEEGVGQGVNAEASTPFITAEQAISNIRRAVDADTLKLAAEIAATACKTAPEKLAASTAYRERLAFLKAAAEVE
jgi:hypothetical protein